jgi:predicted HNH restriction endonuclease
MVHASSSINHSPSNIKDTNQGPLTRSRAKKLQEQVNSFLTYYNFIISKNVILPKCSILMFLRYAHEDMEDTVLQNGSVGKVARTDDRTQGKVARTDDRTPEGKVTRTDNRTSERNSHNF